MSASVQGVEMAAPRAAGRLARLNRLDVAGLFITFGTLIGAIIWAFPLYWGLITTFKHENEIVRPGVEIVATAVTHMVDGMPARRNDRACEYAPKQQAPKPVPDLIESRPAAQQPGTGSSGASAPALRTQSANARSLSKRFSCNRIWSWQCSARRVGSNEPSRAAGPPPHGAGPVLHATAPGTAHNRGQLLRRGRQGHPPLQQSRVHAEER